MKEFLNEDRIEELYWIFYDKVKSKHRSERDCFKEAMRLFAREEIKNIIDALYFQIKITHELRDKIKKLEINIKE